MEHYSFFDAENSGSGFDRVYSSADLAQYFSSFVGNGVYANPANQLQVVATTGLDIEIKIGKAWINGYFYELSQQNKKISLERGDAYNPRIDSVICSLNMAKRLVEVKVVKGVASPSPKPYTLIRSKEQWDLRLATINIPAGCVDVKQSQIKDCRGTSECGFVAGLIEQIDSEGFFAQYEASFQEWFENVKGTLSGDAAGNLNTKLSDLEAKHNQDVITINQTIDSKCAAVQSKADAANKAQDTKISSNTTKITNLEKRIKMGTAAAPATGTANSIYIQLL